MDFSWKAIYLYLRSRVPMRSPGFSDGNPPRGGVPRVMTRPERLASALDNALF